MKYTQIALLLVGVLSTTQAVTLDSHSVV
jgi:hypothetical protein